MAQEGLQGGSPRPFREAAGIVWVDFGSFGSLGRFPMVLGSFGSFWVVFW